MNILNVS